jgi:hypothetical protein
VASFSELDPTPSRVVEVYDYMMREQVGPALREIGFKGTLRTFKYGRDGRFGSVTWQKNGKAAYAQIMLFTGNVNYIADGGRIAELMPVPTTDTWWEVRGGQPTGEVAASVVDVIGRYLVQAIEAALDDPNDPPADDPRLHQFRGRIPDTGGADPAAWFLQPTGAGPDRAFTEWFTSDESRDRYDAAYIVAADAPDDPRTVPAVLDRLEHDPSPHVRKLVATRVLPVLAREPRVVTALHAAADTDDVYGVRWAARYALRLSASSNAAAS